MKEIRIAIADDNKPMVEFMKEFIEERSNLKIYRTVTSSKEEIEMMNNDKIDLIITDIMRKGESISGLDIIKQAEKEKRKEKFILLTASSEKELEYLTNYKIPSNIIGYLKKPFFDWNIIITELEKAVSIIENIPEEHSNKKSNNNTIIPKNALEKIKDRIKEIFSIKV